MTGLPARHAIARAAADSVVLLADPDSRAANPFYWHRAQHVWRAVGEILAQAPDPAVARAVEAVRLSPGILAHYDRLCRAITRQFVDDRAPLSRALLDAVVRVHDETRIGYQPGGVRAQPGTRPRLQARPRSEPEEPVVNVVIPFRDASPEHRRLGNLTACLASLADQSLDQRRYAVTVVESDTVPRWRERLSPLVDEYLFVHHDGPFNKSWTVNVGAVRTRFPAPLVCVLDADALTDREFLERNVSRFDAPGVGSFTPLDTVLYLDADSSAWAIEHRCVHGADSAGDYRARGFLVYCSPGICVWMRRSVFDSIHGLDERYEGWGGEDMDLLLRLMTRSAFHQFDDVQLHLHHPVRGGLLDEDGNTPNAGLSFLTWEPSGPIGDPVKYSLQQA